LKTEAELAEICRKINSILIDNRLNYYEMFGVMKTVETYHQGALITIHSKGNTSMFKVKE
jgi:hypothetical protein